MKTNLLCILTLFLIGQIPVMGALSEPTVESDKPASYRQSKQMWAHSFLYAKAPEIVVEKWLTKEPETEGKFVLVEYWATWCSACRKAQPLMNTLQEKFGEELVIIGISDEEAGKVEQYVKDKQVRYHMAIDTQSRMKNQLGVWGIPHITISEPGGYVIWEGFPLLEGYELKEETIQRILEIGRSQKPD